MIRLAAFVLGLRFTPLVPGQTDPRYVAADAEATAVIASHTTDLAGTLALDDVTGEIGEVCVRGGSVTTGYWRDRN